MRVETLVSCVDKEETALALTMGLEEDAIIVNQTSEAGEYCFFMREGQIIIADDGEKTSPRMMQRKQVKKTEDYNVFV